MCCKAPPIHKVGSRAIEWHYHYYYILLLFLLLLLIYCIDLLCSFCLSFHPPSWVYHADANPKRPLFQGTMRSAFVYAKRNRIACKVYHPAALYVVAPPPPPRHKHTAWSGFRAMRSGHRCIMCTVRRCPGKFASRSSLETSCLLWIYA